MLAAAGTRRRRLVGVVGAVALSALTLGACSAGQDAQTVEQTSVVDGTAFEAGGINLRDVGLRPPAGNSYAVGSNAYLEGLVVNTNADDDQLVSVTSPIATSVVFYADGVAALLATGSSPSATAAPSESGSATVSTTPTDTAPPTQGGTPSNTAESPSEGSSATGSATGSETPSSAPSPTTSAAAPEPLQRIDLATNQSVQFGYANGQPAIVLLGLKQAMFPAQSFEVTFTFASGATVTANVSVKLPVGRSLEAPTVSTEEQEGGE